MDRDSAAARATARGRIIRFGPFALDVRAAELRKHGVRVRLPRQSFQMLLLLLERPGEVVLREEIRFALWPNGTIVEFDHSINAATKNLRAALGDSPDDPQYVETVGRQGYRFIAPMEPNPAAAAEQPCVELEQPGVGVEGREGAAFSHFHIIRKLSEGGMGEVYLAADLQHGRQVALKLLACGADPLAVERFRRQAVAAAALSHPHICTIHGVEECDGQPVLVMEFLDGETLAARLARGPMPLQEALAGAIQIAGAVAEAHRKGIVHRHLTPANIMLTRFGAKVLDFGLAKDQRPPATVDHKTTDGAIAGTLPYMSPEQAEGKPADARSDIFSFGAILYQMLSGRRAFTGDSQTSTLAAVIRAEPMPLVDFVERVPRDLVRLVTRCLRKDVARRAQNMTDVQLALEDLNEELEAELAQAPAPREKPRRTTRITAVALVVAAAGLAGLFYSSRREVAFEAVPLTSYPGSESSPSFSPDGSQVAFIWAKNPPSSAEVAPGNVYVKLIGGGPPLRLTAGAAADWAPAWSPDGKWIAFSRLQGRSGVYLIPALGGPERLLAEGVGAAALAWSPDGRWLAAALRPDTIGREPEAGMRLISVDSGEVVDPAKQNPELAGARRPSFSPDGKRMAYLAGSGDWSGQIYVVNLGSGMRIDGRPVQVTFERTGALYPTWTADGREIVFMAGSSQSSGALSRVVPDGRGRARRIAGLGYTSGPIAIAPRGARMAFSRGGVDSDIWRFDLKNEDPAGRWASSTLFENSAAYSPDGRRIAISSARTGSREIWVMDSDGSNAQQYTHFGGPITGAPRWSPDGRWIAFDSRPGGDPEIFVIGSEGVGIRRLTNRPGEDARPCWSPDGKWIYYSSDQTGRLEIWRMPAFGGEPEQVTKEGGITVLAAPDGEWLYYVRPGRATGLRKIRFDGSGDSLAVEGKIGFLGYAVTQTGVWFLNNGEAVTLEVVRFANGMRSQVLQVPFRPGNGLSLTPDERYVLLTRPDDKGTDLMLVEGFR